MASFMFTIATLNVNSLTVRLPQVLRWLAKENIDILALQETKTIDEKFPVAEINAAGYQVVFSGQKTYNGMAILSRKPAGDITTDIPDLDDPQRRILLATIGRVRIVNLYIPNGAHPESTKYVYKLTWLQKVTAYLKQQLAAFPKIVVLGDFNIAPTDQDVYNPVLWEGQVLTTEPERAAWQAILKLGLTDTFRHFTQQPASYSWWDYRGGAFWKNHGLRIDHILSSEALINHCQSCEINKSPRKWPRPSDHTPVIARFTGTL